MISLDILNGIFYLNIPFSIYFPMGYKKVRILYVVFCEARLVKFISKCKSLYFYKDYNVEKSSISVFYYTIFTFLFIFCWLKPPGNCLIEVLSAGILVMSDLKGKFYNIFLLSSIVPIGQ